MTSETKGPWWTAGLEPQRGRKTWSPAQNSRVDLGGVKAAEPVFLSLSLLLAPTNCLSSSSKSCKLWGDTHLGGAELEGKAFECCIDQSTRQMLAGEHRPDQLEIISAPGTEGTRGSWFHAL